jgi:hypothetical protein
LRDSPVELRYRLSQLLLPRLMRGELQLALHFRAREPARFELARAFRIAALGGLPGPFLFFFAFFHALGEAGFRVDESFSSVTHAYDYTY